MKTIKRTKVKLVLVLAVMLGIIVLGACRGLGAVPRGWSGSVLDGGTLFVGSQTGNLVAVNTDDASTLFSAPLESEPAPSGILNCAPSGPVQVAIYGSPAVGENLVFIGGYNGKIYAFLKDEAHVEPRWVYPRQGSVGGVIVGGVAYSDGRIFFGADNNFVYGLEAEGGFKEWEFETGDKVWATPAINGNTLYIGSFDKTFYALDATDGTEKWRFETEGAIVATPLMDDGTVYVGSFDRFLYALDAADGSLKWKFEGSEKWYWAKPVAYDGKIYAGSLDGKVYVVDAATGDKVNEFDLGSPVSASLALVDDTVVAATEAGSVYALGADGRQRELASLGERINAPLGAGEGRVYVHTSNGRLVEIGVSDGSKRDISIGSSTAE